MKAPNFLTLGVFLAVVVLFLLVAFGCTTPQPAPLQVGDLNGDGVVNAADLQVMKSCLGMPINGNCIRADLNHDGTISVLDWGMLRALVEPDTINTTPIDTQP